MKINNITTLYDKILIAAVVVISIIMLLIPFYFLSSSDGGEKILVVQQNNEIIRRIPLADSYEDKIEFTVEGPIGTHIIEAENGRVRVQEAPADDPLKICERTGWIEREGPIIVCVPNSLSIWLESTDSDIDGMSW